MGAMPVAFKTYSSRSMHARRRRTAMPMPLISAQGTHRARSSCRAAEATSLGAAVKCDSVRLRDRLSQEPWPMNLGGSGAPALRRLSLSVRVRPCTPAASSRLHTSPAACAVRLLRGQLLCFGSGQPHAEMPHPL